MKINHLKVLFLAVMLFAGSSSRADQNPKLLLPKFTDVPALTETVERNTVELGGTWEFNHAEKKELLADAWSDIEVPGQWLQQGFIIDSNNAGYYRKRFSVPQSWANMIIKLRCDGIYSQSRIWINGKLLGSNVGGFTGFELDATGIVRPGQANQIDVEVKTNSLADVLATGTRYAAHDLGGITRKIYLFAVPRVHISSVQLQTSFDDKYEDATLNATFEITNDSKSPLEKLKLRFKIRELLNNKMVRLEPLSIDVNSIPPNSTVKHTQQFKVKRPKKWDCEHPNLYHFFYDLYARGRRLSIGRETIGFRDIKIKDQKLYINGKAVKLKGICWHQAHPLYGRSLPDEFCETDLKLLKEANINFVRTSHYPPPEEFIAACDKYGIFVEEEAPFCWAGHLWGNPYWKDHDFDDPNVRELIVKETLAMAYRDKNHPSIIMWSLANESKWTKVFENSGNALKAFDPTRPRKFTNPPDNGFCEIEVWHYPGPDGPAKTADCNRPVIFSEYCHLNTYDRRELYTDPGLHDYWGKGFSQMWRKMFNAENCIGGSIWAGISDKFYIPDITGNIKMKGYGDWGPFDGWRRKKPEFWHIKKTYSPVKILDEKVVLPRKPKAKIKIKNNYVFSNLNELDIVVKTADTTLKLNADIAPATEGYLYVPIRAFANTNFVQLDFIDRSGRLVDTFALQVVNPNAKNNTKKESAKEKAITPPTMNRQGNTITITGDNFQWHFDAATGLLSKAVIDSNEIPIAGPTLTVTPLLTGKDQIAQQTIEVLNGELKEFHASKVDMIKTQNEAIIQMIGKYGDTAEGFYTMVFDGSGRAEIGYRFAYQQDINPRETGLTFTLGRSFDLLSWERLPQFSAYPEDHIARPIGSAKALPDPDQLNLSIKHKPTWPWSLDATAAGTNDFRSSKHNINFASLTNPAGIGLMTLSDATQASRTYIQDDKIKWLIADYSNGGIDPFFKKHVKKEYKPLKKGDVIKGTVILQLIGLKE